MLWLAAMVAVAGPTRLPVATRTLEPGAIITATDLRWIEVDHHDTIADTWPDPVGWLVVDRILGGEAVRAERLLDPDKPERFAPPGMRVLRIPVAPDRDRKGERVDVRVAGDPPCALLTDRFVLGHGTGPDGRPDSSWLLLELEEAFAVLAEARAMTLADATRGGAPCSR